MENKKCKKCGNELKIYYGEFCPVCSPKEEFEFKYNRKIYNLFPIMDHMEAKGFMSKNKYFQDYIVESYPQIGNDMFIEMMFLQGSDKEINKYHAYLEKFLGLDPEEEESVIMWISW